MIPVFLQDNGPAAQYMFALIEHHSLSPVVMKITKNYVARIIKKEDVKPMLSVFPEIQQEQEKAM